MINEGVCGDTSGGGAARIGSVLARWRPSVVLILFSPNDLPIPVDTVIGNLRFMIRAARDAGAIPILGTLTPARGPHQGWERFILLTNEGIRALAREQHVPLADHHRAFALDRAFTAEPAALLSPDGLHPNSRGYDLMAATWSRVIRGMRGGSPAGPGRDGPSVPAVP